MKLDKERPFGTIKSVDDKQKIYFNQDGIDYDKNGNPVDKKQVKTFNQGVLDAAQKVAFDAQAVADAAHAEADAARALLDDPDSPQTVVALKDALDELDVDYSPNAKKPELEQLWVDSQAA